MKSLPMLVEPESLATFINEGDVYMWLEHVAEVSSTSPVTGSL